MSHININIATVATRPSWGAKIYIIYRKSAIDAAHIDIDKRRKKYINIYIHTQRQRERERVKQHTYKRL